MQLYNAEYSRIDEVTAERVGDAARGEAGVERIKSGQVAINIDGPIYQGRAHSAKELFAQTQPYKNSITQQAARFLVQDPDSTSEATDIRHWRRALDQVWSDTPSDIQDGFLSRAANLAVRVNRCADYLAI